MRDMKDKELTIGERIFWVSLGVLAACVVCKPLIPLIARLTGQEYE